VIAHHTRHSTFSTKLQAITQIEARDATTTLIEQRQQITIHMLSLIRHGIIMDIHLFGHGVLAIII
jgi:hypothetical protein